MNIRILGFLLLILTSCKEKNKQGITIATAANMQYVMEELVHAFSKKYKITSTIVVSSSGVLVAQIANGAPYDIFVAANMKYPNSLYTKGLTKYPPQVYAYGQLVLFTMKDALQPSIPILKQDVVKHIAIANPKTAPYGEAAIEVLQYYKLLDSIKHKLIYGQSISQTDQFIMSRTVDMGITAKSVVISPQMKNKGAWIEIPSDAYTSIAQGVVMLKSKQNSNKEVQLFYDFLFSEEAKKILKDFGYLVP